MLLLVQNFPSIGSILVFCLNRKLCIHFILFHEAASKFMLGRYFGVSHSVIPLSSTATQPQGDTTSGSGLHVFPVQVGKKPKT